MFLFFLFFLFFFSPRYLGAPSSDRRETLPRDRKYVQFYNPGHKILGAFLPKNWGRKRAELRSTSDNIKIRSRISIQNGQRCPKSKTNTSTAIPPAFDEKKSPVNTGDWFTNIKIGHVSLDPPKSTVSEDHISARRGCCLLKSLHALENEQNLLTHTQPGTGVFPTIFNKQNLKIGPKCFFLISSANNFGAKGIKLPHETFPRDRCFFFSLFDNRLIGLLAPYFALSYHYVCKLLLILNLV